MLTVDLVLHLHEIGKESSLSFDACQALKNIGLCRWKLAENSFDGAQFLIEWIIYFFAAPMTVISTTRFFITAQVMQKYMRRVGKKRNNFPYVSGVNWKSQAQGLDAKKRCRINLANTNKYNTLSKLRNKGSAKLKPAKIEARFGGCTAPSLALSALRRPDAWRKAVKTDFCIQN